jgi:hypothetical protein
LTFLDYLELVDQIAPKADAEMVAAREAEEHRLDRLMRARPIHE